MDLQRLFPALIVGVGIYFLVSLALLFIYLPWLNVVFLLLATIIAPVIAGMIASLEPIRRRYDDSGMEDLDEASIRP